MGRNKAPSENTVRMLCSKSAGMCEFEGCNKRLFFDGITLSKFNNAYVAHIIASSAEGPRGDKTLSPLLSDKLENLMLILNKTNIQLFKSAARTILNGRKSQRGSRKCLGITVFIVFNITC